MNRATYTITADDLAAANRLHFRQYVGVWSFVKLWIAGAIVLASMIFLLEKSFDSTAYLFGLIIGGIALAALFVLSWLNMKYQAKRRWAQAHSMWTEQQVSWDPDAIHFASKRGDIRIGWQDFYRWTSDTTSILLYQDSGTFLLVPARSLPPGAVDEIRQILQSVGVAEQKRT